MALFTVTVQGCVTINGGGEVDVYKLGGVYVYKRGGDYINHRFVTPSMLDAHICLYLSVSSYHHTRRKTIRGVYFLEKSSPTPSESLLHPPKLHIFLVGGGLFVKLG